LAIAAGSVTTSTIFIRPPHFEQTDGAFEERGEELPFLAAPPPTPERMTAILASVHDAILARGPDDELDLDPALATCVQQSLRGPSLAAAAPDTEPRPCTVSAFGMHLLLPITPHGPETITPIGPERLAHPTCPRARRSSRLRPLPDTFCSGKNLAA